MPLVLLFGVALVVLVVTRLLPNKTSLLVPKQIKVRFAHIYYYKCL